MDRFLKLSVTEPLERAIIRRWFNCVIENGPSGVVNAVTIADDDDERHVVRLIHQVTAHRHSYLIPLTRDLRTSEIDRVVEQFAAAEPDLDFDVETNEKRLRSQEHDTIPLDTAKHLALCTALAKRRHEDWVRGMTDNGWRYGVKLDQDEKTHPLLRPWDQIPERFRTPDLDTPQQLISMLNDNGYVVVSRDELENMINKPAVA